MENLQPFQDFVATFPQWKLWQEAPDVYGIGINIHTADELMFDPDAVIGGYDSKNLPLSRPAYAPFRLASVQNATFDGTILIFRLQGQTYTCDSRTGKIAVK